MQKAILEPTRTGRGFRIRIGHRVYYASYTDVMLLTYSERKSVVFKAWQAVEKAFEARKSMKKVIGTSEG